MSKVNFEELLNNQREINKLFKEIEGLNQTHNEYLDNAKGDFDLRFNLDDQVRTIKSKKSKAYSGFWGLYFVESVLNIFRILNPFIVFVCVLVQSALLSLALFILKRKLLSRENQLKDEENTKKEKDNEICSQLCEKLSLYREMIKEQDSKVIQLSDEEYQEFLELLNVYSDKEYQEYIELVDEYSQILDSIMETYDKSKEESTHVSVEIPKKRNLFSNFLANKSKKQ